MCHRGLCLFLLFAALPAAAGGKPENWIQVTSPHFLVVTNSNQKQGRRVADQFERMRSLFHSLAPKAQMDNGSPIIVLAVKDEKDFRALEPESYLAKGSLKLTGLFLRGADKNYVLMRLDAEGEHPYAVIYHEYTHFVLSRIEFIPLWLNEGLAEFYQNTDIHEKEAALGQPSVDNILWLRRNRILPLTTLLAVDHSSPYYHEENKGSIFYAESWALTHYLKVSDFAHKTQRLTDYLNLVSQKADPVTAASQAFGDLKKLQTELEAYVRSDDSSKYFKVTTTTEVDDSAFKIRPLTEPQSEAVRADFLAYNQRTADAQALLDHVLQQDPQSVSAHETKGYLEFRAGHLEEARKWYAQAVQMDSQSFLAHYYFAAMSINAPDPPPDEQVESSLRAAIKLNPFFSPAFDLLATFLGMHGKSLDEAHMMGLTAVSLDPSNVRYRINVANILLRMDKTDAAMQVLNVAEKIASHPAEAQLVKNFLEHAKQYAENQERRKEEAAADAELANTEASAETGSDLSPAPAAFVEKGPHRFLTGLLKNVHCASQKMDLTLTSKVMNLDLHSENYYQVQYTTLNFAPKGNINPCKDLEGRPAKVEYVESADKSVVSRVLSIELHK